MPGNARGEGNKQSDGERYDDKKNQPDEPTPPPPLASFFEEKLCLAKLRLNTGGVDNRHGGPSNRLPMELL
jgi:hypothetical protein